ncbi:MAG: hypothetical protein JW994_05770 [Candidatus Omnitrophica bacterium]|nr:hypothetical protein [Candidatus Omnitrophota bacterium]
MCCDICPKYLECEENNTLKDDCCKQCPDYNYCMGEDSANTDKEYGEDE